MSSAQANNSAHAGPQARRKPQAPSVREPSAGHRRATNTAGSVVELRLSGNTPAEIRALARECNALAAKIARARKVLTILKRERRRNEGPVTPRVSRASLRKGGPSIGRVTEQAIRACSPPNTETPPQMGSQPAGPTSTARPRLTSPRSQGAGPSLTTPTYPVEESPGEGELPSTGH